jgi:alkylhydroperoxidase/carboxymuconolactone decarboxylase family protein YurZ
MQSETSFEELLLQTAVYRGIPLASSALRVAANVLR